MKDFELKFMGISEAMQPSNGIHPTVMIVFVALTSFPYINNEAIGRGWNTKLSVGREQ